MIFPNELRSITVAIINLEWCRNHYHGFAPITDKNICTFDEERLRGCCLADSGGPLVVDGRLLGVNSWSRAHVEDPDVFINVAERNHSIWISVIMRTLKGKF